MVMALQCSTWFCVLAQTHSVKKGAVHRPLMPSTGGSTCSSAMSDSFDLAPLSFSADSKSAKPAHTEHFDLSAERASLLPRELQGKPLHPPSALTPASTAPSWGAIRVAMYPGCFNIGPTAVRFSSRKNLL